MALKLVTSIKGCSAEYWRIDRFDIDKKAKRVWLRLGLYKDSDYAHTEGAKPVETKEMTFSGDNYPVDIDELNQADNNIFNVLYAQIKEPVMVDEVNTNEFTESEDC